MQNASFAVIGDEVIQVRGKLGKALLAVLPAQPLTGYMQFLHDAIAGLSEAVMLASQYEQARGGIERASAEMFKLLPASET